MMMRYVVLVSLFSVCACITVQHPVKAVYRGWEDIVWSNVTGSVVCDQVDAGFNFVIMNFYAPYDKNAFDAAEAWKNVDQASKAQAMDYAHSKGAVVVGGVKLKNSYGNPYAQVPADLGALLGGWAVENQLDGLDVNFQDISQGFVTDAGGNLTAWSVALLTAIRTAIGSDRILSIAGPPSYFGPVGSTNTYVGATGGLIGVYNAIPTQINYIILWYFLQPADCVASYDILFVSTAGSTACSVNTAVAEIVQAGAPADKTIIAVAERVSEVSGYVEPHTLATYIWRATASYGWNTGVAAWNWGGGVAPMSTWVAAVFAQQDNTTTTTPTPVSTTTTPTPVSTTTTTTTPITTTTTPITTTTTPTTTPVTTTTTAPITSTSTPTTSTPTPTTTRPVATTTTGVPVVVTSTTGGHSTTSGAVMHAAAPTLFYASALVLMCVLIL